MNFTNQKVSNLIPIQQQSDLQEQIQILYHHQKTCEKQGKYLEADLAKTKLNELTKSLDIQYKHEVVDRHSDEKQQIDKAHFDEFNQFTFTLLNFISTQLRNVIILFISIVTCFGMKNQNNSILRLNKQKMRFYLDINQNQHHFLKNQIIQFYQNQKIQHNCQNQGRPKNNQQSQKSNQHLNHLSYKEAHMIQQRILYLEKLEFDKWNQTRLNKIKNLIQQLRQKQIIELNALQQRILSVQEDLSKNKSQELQKMLSKYQHVRIELENQQNQEINRLEKSIKNQSIMSKMNSQMKKPQDENYNLK